MSVYLQQVQFRWDGDFNEHINLGVHIATKKAANKPHEVKVPRESNTRYVENKQPTRQKCIKNHPYVIAKTLVVIGSSIALAIGSAGLSLGATACVCASITLFNVVSSAIIRYQQGQPWTVIIEQALYQIIIAVATFGWFNGLSDTVRYIAPLIVIVNELLFLMKMTHVRNTARFG
jgi:hypothetical protein